MGEREDSVPGVKEHLNETLILRQFVDLGQALIITWESQPGKTLNRNTGMMPKRSEIPPLWSLYVFRFYELCHLVVNFLAQYPKIQLQFGSRPPYLKG